MTQWVWLLFPLLFWGPIFWIVPRGWTAFISIPAAIIAGLFFLL